MYKGGSGKGENDPIGAEVNLEQFLFGGTNPYALSNNTKLSMVLKGKELKNVGSGIESTLIKEADMKPT